MSKIFVGNITAEAEKLLNKYLNKFMPDAVIEPLKAAGIKGKIKNHTRRPEVAMVIIDETLYNMCVGVADDVLSLPKVHKYVDDNGLQEFLEKKFGVLDESAPTTVHEADKEVVDEVVEDFKNLVISDDEDTSNDSDKDSIICKLNDELIMRDTMIRNLEAQIEEKSSSSDVSHFISRIKDLEADLEEKSNELSKIQNDSYTDLGKVARAEQIIQSVEELKESLSEEKEKCIKLEKEKSELENEIKKKESELEMLRLDNSSLTEKSENYEEVSESLRSLKNEYDLKLKEVEDLNSSNSELEQRVIDLTSQVAEIGVLNEKIDSLTKENKKLRDTANVRVEFENLKIDYNNVLSEKSKLEESKRDLQEELNNVLAEKSDLESSKKFLQEEYDGVSKKLSELSDNISLKDDELDKLTQDNKDLSTKLNELSTDISSKDNELDSLTAKIAELEGSISKKDSEINSLASKVAELNDSISSKDKEFDSLSVTLSDNTKVIEGLRRDLSLKDDKISELYDEISELSTESEKLQSEVGVLRQSATSSEELTKANDDLESKLTEYKRKAIRLESENTTIKEELDKLKRTTNKDIEIANLRTEISDYKSKLRNLQGGSGEISQLRERCANLEIALVEKDEQIRSSEDNIFNKMGSIALPKTVFNLTLDMPDELPNMYVFASGSSESNLITYQTLRRVCSSTDKSVLILDLVTDSYIDREFGVEKISSPIEFLQGNGLIKDCMSKSKVSNAYIVSTAFNYVNSLYFLNVDWKSVLSNLCGVTDIVIINVGCLNEIVSKVLFNAFSSIMQSHIIIKASPINLRTALLTLTGIPSAKMSKISCVNFENSSKSMYQRLAQKFNTQILKDSDVLRL